jgi:hypothetical protein
LARIHAPNAGGDHERRSPAADWQAGIVDHAVGIAKDIILRFNWLNPNLDAARSAIQKMFGRTW